MQQAYSISKLADLAGCAHITMRKRLVSAGAQSDNDGKYTLADVLKALLSESSELQEERTKLVQEQRKKLEHINAESEGRLVDAHAFFLQYSEIFSYIRTIIFSSDLSEDEKKDLSRELQRVVVEKEEWPAFVERMDNRK
jgi:hypothetical protein